MAKRRAQSKVHRLPPEVRAFIEGELRADRLTLDELKAALEKRWPAADLPSRSGLHRYQQGFQELVGRMREIEAVSSAVVGELGEGVGEKAGALLAQAITTLATNAALKAQNDDDLSIEEIRKLARAAKDAIDTRRLSLAERQAIERAAREKLLREQAEKLDKVVKSGGLSEAAAADMRKKILGVA